MKKKTLAQLKNDAQKVFNKYIRLRDSYNGWFTCISCGFSQSTDVMNAGHFFPVKGYDGLRFDEENVNGECVACNGWDEMHLIGYQKNLVKRIGKRGLINLRNRAADYKKNGHKFARYEVEEIIEKYKSKIKEL
jgi:hypothetical protein